MQVINPFWLIIATALLALLPILFGLVTSFVKVSVVLSMIRNALGTQQVPGNMVIMGLSCAITFFVMGPVIEQSFEKGHALKISEITAKNPTLESFAQYAVIFEPWRAFLLKHTAQREVDALMALDEQRQLQLGERGRANPSAVSPSLAKIAPLQPGDIPLRVLIPAFVLGELRQAFTMGVMVLLPFLVIDLIVANVLGGMGMFMMSPVLVSLPIKLLVFVLSDGWLMIVRSLILSYGTV